MLARPRRHRVETQGFKIHLGAIAVLAQDEEPGERGGEAGGRRRLGPMTPTPCRFPEPLPVPPPARLISRTEPVRSLKCSAELMHRWCDLLILQSSIVE